MSNRCKEQGGGRVGVKGIQDGQDRVKVNSMRVCKDTDCEMHWLFGNGLSKAQGMTSNLGLLRFSLDQGSGQSR